MRSALVVRKQRKRYLFTSCLDEAFLSLCCFPESVVFFWTSGTTQKRPLSPGLSRRGYVSINCFACLFIYASLLAFLLSLTDSRFLVGSLFYYFFHSVSQVFPTIFSIFSTFPTFVAADQVSCWLHRRSDFHKHSSTWAFFYGCSYLLVHTV